MEIRFFSLNMEANNGDIINNLSSLFYNINNAVKGNRHYLQCKDKLMWLDSFCRKSNKIDIVFKHCICVEGKSETLRETKMYVRMLESVDWCIAALQYDSHSLKIEDIGEYLNSYYESDKISFDILPSKEFLIKYLSGDKIELLNIDIEFKYNKGDDSKTMGENPSKKLYQVIQSNMKKINPCVEQHLNKRSKLKYTPIKPKEVIEILKDTEKNKSKCSPKKIVTKICKKQKIKLDVSSFQMKICIDSGSDNYFFCAVNRAIENGTIYGIKE